ncbi:hypothetical protein A2U01_0093376, partial [Trifolium medium]|nr:hypothetical protein [Trifolium medium]
KSRGFLPLAQRAVAVVQGAVELVGA